MPGAPVEQLISALHATLSAEFRTAARRHGPWSRTAQAPASAAAELGLLRLLGSGLLRGGSPAAQPGCAARARLAALGGSAVSMGKAGLLRPPRPPRLAVLERAASYVADSTLIDSTRP